MGEELPIKLPVQEVFAPQQQTLTINNNFAIRNGYIIYTGPRLRTFPRGVDPKIAINDPNQTYDDCRTIEGWTDLVNKLLKIAWGTDSELSQFTFTHDFALIPNDPNDIKGVIIVYDVISEEPAMNGSTRELKPRPRQITNDPLGGSKWIWGQMFDVMIAFTIYADSWTRLNVYTEKFKDFMLSYSGIYKQLGLQEIFFHGQMRDALYDPPHAQENPTRTVFYRIKIEKIFNINYAEIEQILIAAGLIDLETHENGDPVVTAVITAVPPSPELPK